MTAATAIDAWSKVCKNLFSHDYEGAIDIHPMHTCVIEGVPHYVHAPLLEHTHPSYFHRLKEHAAKKGIKLKADQRTLTAGHNYCKRKNVLTLIFLALSLNSQVLIADDMDVSLKLISSKAPAPSEIETDVSVANFGAISTANINVEASQKIEHILLSHLEFTQNTPDNLKDDLHKLAEYYASYPESIALVESLEDVQWKLKFAPNTFETNVKGSQLEVKSVEVLFDPRSGAKLKFNAKCDEKKPFCIASPADALLHEFLHAQTALKDTNNYIAQGGLNPYIYPYEHERLTIMKENVLYKAMSQIDHRNRPARTDHSGKAVSVACVTCLQ